MQELATAFETAAGNSFPDGDPHDALTAFYRKKGWDDYEANTKLLPKAVKKYLGAKDSYAYLANMWDSVYGDAKADYEAWLKRDKKERGMEPHTYQSMGGDRARNPWK
jgi:hypothetical protein